MEAAEARVPGPSEADHSHGSRLLQLHGVLGPGRQQRRGQPQRDTVGDEQPGEVQGAPARLLLLCLGRARGCSLPVIHSVVVVDLSVRQEGVEVL